MRAKGNVMGAARLLGLSRSALRYRLRRYGIEPSRLSAFSEEISTAPISSSLAGEQQGGWSFLDQEERNLQGQEGEQAAGPTGDLSTADKPVDAPAPAWEQKPVAVLTIDLTFPKAVDPEALRYAPWTAARRWERTIAEKVQGFGGTILQRGLSLFTVAFGIPQTLDQMPQRAVQAAMVIQRLVAEAGSPASGEPYPELRLALHLARCS
jgi:Bacterial regulatory protein, Fis family